MTTSGDAFQFTSYVTKGVRRNPPQPPFGRLIARSTASVLNYVHQDHLGGTSLVTSDNGTQLGAIKYYPFVKC